MLFHFLTYPVTVRFRDDFRFRNTTDLSSIPLRPIQTSYGYGGICVDKRWQFRQFERSCKINSISSSPAQLLLLNSKKLQLQHSLHDRKTISSTAISRLYRSTIMLNEMITQDNSIHCTNCYNFPDFYIFVFAVSLNSLIMLS